ncbi:hypothetical protein [Streptomyces sp. UNOC14_S4]|uniref:hypothetical protein n=1 Tax=Streptomyces sp. UNOC14_S4 TaxID=2872340 RepID=UPI001E5BB4FD|nr:hypothetical protein [Streptomyces sp. UNOC14_S4]MCC3768531.1 hypothetical protein [Streptomyces sp. UNOC14_S4]
MIHISETLAIQTVEDFLGGDETARLVKIMDTEATGWRPRRQAEILPAPALAQEILSVATVRALPAIRRVMPSVAAFAPWGYTEMTAGQCVPSHVDGITSPRTAPRRIGRLRVVIAEADEGGRLYMETTADPAPWTTTVLGVSDGYVPGTPLARSLPHEMAEDPHAAEDQWLAATVRTRWLADAGRGVAVAYGAQLIHGVTPVVRGRLRLLVTDLTDAPVS